MATLCGMKRTKRRMPPALATKPTRGTGRPTRAVAAATITSPINRKAAADGTTATLKGVLEMRADGMGGGQIARDEVTKLGPVVSSIKLAGVKVATLPGRGAAAVPRLRRLTMSFVRLALAAPPPPEAGWSLPAARFFGVQEDTC